MTFLHKQTNEQTDKRTNGQTDKWTENLPILQDFVPYRGRCPKKGNRIILIAGFNEISPVPLSQAVFMQIMFET